MSNILRKLLAFDVLQSDADFGTASPPQINLGPNTQNAYIGIDHLGNLWVNDTQVGGGALTPIPGGNTSGGAYFTSSADFSSLLPPGDPTNLGINVWIKGNADQDTYTVFQAGTTVEARHYHAFLGRDGTYRWLTGKNGGNGEGSSFGNWILYDANYGQHRMVLMSAQNGSGGNTYFCSGGSGAIRLNGNDTLSTEAGHGGIEMWSGGVVASNIILARCEVSFGFTLFNNSGLGFSANSSTRDTSIYRSAAGVINISADGSLSTFAGTLKLGGVIATTAAPTVAASQVGIGSTTATSATAGVNGAVPAQVAGYLIINVGGTSQKVPYFNA